MALKRADFECWLIQMDDSLAEFMQAVPKELASQLDYSLHSLTPLETWLLAKYKNTPAILRDSEKQLLDQLGRYVGETMRKNFGGIWNMELKQKRDVYFGMPVLERNNNVECPVSVVTASLDRRTGDFMREVAIAFSED